MAIGASLSAWWSAWKFVVLLAAALAGSLYLNYWQHRLAITAPLRDQVAGLEGALEDSQALHQAVRESTARLTTAASDTQQVLRGAARDYRKAVADRPMTNPECAPGQARVDAVNRALGAPTKGEQ